MGKSVKSMGRIKYWTARNQAVATAIMQGDSAKLQSIIGATYKGYHKTVDNASITKGNTKIGFTPNFSLPAYFACPKQAKRTCGNCKNAAYCYALKDYRYPTVTANRFVNWYLAIKKPVELKAQIIDFVQKHYKKHGFFFFRLHESGDFFSAAYLDMWIEIAKECKEMCMFYTYSKAFDVLTERINAIPPNLCIMISKWDGLYIPPVLLTKFPVADVIMDASECPKNVYLCPATGKKDDDMTCAKCGYMCARHCNVCFVYHN